MARRLVVSVFSMGLLALQQTPPAVGQPAGPGAAANPQPAAAPAQAPQFAAKTEAVALDIVVRDKKGRLVTDLQPNEVEVLEDGVPQKLTSFRALESGAPGPAGAAAPAAAGTPAAGPGVAGAAATPGVAPSPGASSPATPAASRRVVLVFGRLGSDARRLAQGAGDEFARKHVSPQTVVSVVRIDGGLIPVLDASSDPAAVKEAVRKATAAIGAGALPRGGPAGDDASYSGQQLSRFEGGAGSRDLSHSDSIAFVSALTGVVEGLQASPGRKTVLVFSEGFVVPTGYENVFAGLLSRANRANVSLYGIDVRGLQLSSQLGSSGAALATAATLSEQQRNSGSGSPVNREQATQDDVVQSSLHSDAVDTLQQMSSSTGGFLVTQTNDFGRSLARIAEDVRGYYEAGYTPSAPAAPGQFRRIEVRVARKDVRVQARSGYYTTLPGPSASAVALAALSAAELPHDFELRSRVFRFGRSGGDAFDCLLKLEASLAAAGFKTDAQGRLSGRMALAGRVLDATGGVVETFGQEVALGGTPEQVAAARRQTLPLARRLRLKPGSYTVELVVRDTVGDKTSAQRLPLTVPSPEGDLAISSLVVVSAVDPADPKADPSDPLLLGDKRIVPNLGGPVTPTPGAMLPVYYAAYVKPGSTQAPTVALEVSRDGKVVLRGSSPTAAPDAAGRITGLLPIPMQKLSAGSYDVKVTVSDGKRAVEETTSVRIGS